MVRVGGATTDRMNRIWPISRSPAALMVCLLIVGLWQVWEGSWIYAKAGLAQFLLLRAWSRTLAGEPNVEPWPWADTWPVARLTIPGKPVDLIVLNGAYGRTLAFGPGYVEASAPPGSPGTTILTGHRDTHFRFLRDLQDGDRIVMQTSTGRSYTYQVHARRIVSTANDRIVMKRDRLTLVLVTCYPFESLSPGGPLRYVVTAYLY
jgi:sortase A